MSNKLKLKKQDEIKNTILDAARNIISSEGIEKLSIRKITNKIGYSPAIVYHYFKDKNEIVEILVGEGYKKILDSIKLAKRNEENPEEEIEEVFTNYIKAALASPDEYKAFMLNEDPSVLKKTSLLYREVSNKSQTMKLLCDTIRRGIKKGRFKQLDPELTAQIIWTSTFGLIMKIIVEKDISEEQENRLIEHHFTVLFQGIMKNKEG